MALYNRDKALADNVKRAEDDLKQALEKERPDELGKPKPGEKEEKVEPIKAPGDSEDMTWKDRYGNLQRYVQKIKDENKQTVAKLTADIDKLKEQVDGMTAKGAPTELPQSDEELNDLKKNNPSAYNAIVKLATGIADEIVTRKTKDLSSKFQEIETKAKEVKEEEAFVQLAKLHPELDVYNLDADPRFVEWFDKQPARIQSILTDQKEDVAAASSVLRMFEQEYGIGKKKSTEKLPKKSSAAQEVEVGGTPNIPQPPAGYEFTESQIDEMDRVNPKWFDENAERIEKAIKEGRVLLDITDPIGTARRLASRAA